MSQQGLGEGSREGSGEVTEEECWKDHRTDEVKEKEAEGEDKERNREDQEREQEIGEQEETR